MAETKRDEPVALEAEELRPLADECVKRCAQVVGDETHIVVFVVRRGENGTGLPCSHIGYAATLPDDELRALFAHWLGVDGTVH